MAWRVVVDLGATFADFVQFEEETSGLKSLWVPSRQQNPSASVMNFMKEAGNGPRLAVECTC